MTKAAQSQQLKNDPIMAVVREGVVAQAGSKRKRTLRPRGWFMSLLVKLATWYEDQLARFSVHGDPPVYDDLSQFPWVADIEAEWTKIRDELHKVLERREELANFHDITSQVETITNDDNWKTYFLAGYGMACDANQQQCPETTRLIQKIPGMKTAMFSILSPGKHIPHHRGPYNGILRYHLGLIVPEDVSKCRIRVHDQVRHWEAGKSLIFDDTFDHEVRHDADGVRVVLFVDFERPLRFPFNLINRVVLALASRTPLLREAKRNQKRWEKKFYGQKQA